MEERTKIEEATLIHLHDKVKTGIKVRLVIYFLIALVSLGIVTYHTWRDGIEILLPLGGILVGFGIGLAISRIQHIKWDKVERKVISEMDTLGIIMLILYIAFLLYRERVIGYFIHGPALATVAFALLSRTMIGRIIGVHQRIRKVFIQKRIIKKE